MTRWFAVLLAALLLLLPQPVQAETLETLYGRALQASQSGDFVGALPLWDQVLELSPDDAAALSNRGEVLRLALGDPLMAIVDQTRSIEYPEELDPHLNRGTCWKPCRTGRR